MPMKLKVVLPVESDIVSPLRDDDGSLSTSYEAHYEKNSSSSLTSCVHNTFINGSVPEASKTRPNSGQPSKKPSSSLKKSRDRPVPKSHRRNESPKHANDESTRDQEQRQQIQKQFRDELRKQETRRIVILQTQHEMCDGTFSQGPCVIVNNNITSTQPVSTAERIVKAPNDWQSRRRFLKDVQLSVTDTYDLELEYSDIMMKALSSYSQHCGESRNKHGNETDKITRNNVRPTSDNRVTVFNILTGKNEQLDSQSNSYKTVKNKESVEGSRAMKMSQCRVRFYDDGVDDTNIKQNSATLFHKAPLLYPLENADGVLADAQGRVYRSTQTRPWLALPGKLCAPAKRVRQRLGLNGERRFKNSSCPDFKSRPPSRSTSNPGRQLKAETLPFSDNMSEPIPHSVAFQRRNQTTHLWTDSSQHMSQSVPGNGFLHRTFGSLSSSPRSFPDDSSEKTSPAGQTIKTRPSSSYSYDGGFFVGAHSGHAEYFVIHPDWVSEALTVKKLSLSEKKTSSSLQRNLSLRTRSLPDGRRCMSAPPKQRNPITMDHSKLAN